jgi:phage-related minor tail protein
MGRDAYKAYLKREESRRAGALSAAVALLNAGDDAGAERVIAEAERDLAGAVLLAHAGREHLRAVVAEGDARSPRGRAAFERALRWSESAWPDPHTEEEADRFSQGRAEGRAELVRILGYDPSRA